METILSAKGCNPDTSMDKKKRMKKKKVWICPLSVDWTMKEPEHADEVITLESFPSEQTPSNDTKTWWPLPCQGVRIEVQGMSESEFVYLH